MKVIYNLVLSNIYPNFYALLLKLHFLSGNHNIYLYDGSRECYYVSVGSPL